MSDSNCFCLFWRPSYEIKIPAPSPHTVIIPLDIDCSSLAFPEIELMISPTNTVTAENIAGIRGALDSLVTDLGKSYVFCRCYFFSLALLTLLYGILNLALNPAGAFVPFLLSFFWMSLTRLMANNLMTSLQDAEIVMEEKVRDLSKAYLGNELEVKMGRAMQWVEVSVPECRRIALTDPSVTQTKRRECDANPDGSSSIAFSDE